MGFLGIGNGKKKKQAAELNTRAMQQLIDAKKAGLELDEDTTRLFLAEADGDISGREKKLLKKTMKQENRTQRSDYRNQARKVAYENGIDPNAGVANAIAAGVGSIAQGVVGVSASKALGQIGRSAQGDGQTGAFSLDSIMGQLQEKIGGGSAGRSATYDEGNEAVNSITGGKNNTILIVGALAVVAFLFMSKSRR